MEPRKTILSRLYLAIYKSPPPYYCYYSVLHVLAKIIRKYFSVVIIPNTPFASLRILMYRWCGYKIGKGVFIGMKCYLDDLCYKEIEIENHVVISYGVYFACHGKGQGHNKIIIQEGAYIGMRSSLISKDAKDLVIGKNAVVGACTLVHKSIPDGATCVGVPGRCLAKESSS